jgi:proteasome lid subunit RPN8/RPN11
VPARCYPIKNSASDPAQQFFLNEKEHIEAIKLMRERGEVLFAIYHSHPSAAAFPSLKDLSLANYEKVLYLIISLNTKGILEMRGFYIEGRQAGELPLALCE